jgi:hypothetical protein
MAFEIVWVKTLEAVADFNTDLRSIEPERSSSTWIFVFWLNKYMCGVLRGNPSTVMGGKLFRALSIVSSKC